MRILHPDPQNPAGDEGFEVGDQGLRLASKTTLHLFPHPILPPCAFVVGTGRTKGDGS